MFGGAPITPNTSGAAMPVNDKIDKIVMVIGESGVGKSTIINMLYNQDTTESCCQGPARTGSTANSVTKHSTLHINMQRRWCFVDTVGVGDPELGTDEILGAIRAMLAQLSRGVDAVVLVMKMERVPMASRANIHVLQSIFRDGDIKTNGVLVLTHWDGELGEEAEDLRAWLQGDDAMNAVVDSFGKVILTNNKIGRRGAYPECRRECLLKLSEVIGANRPRIYARPVNVKDILIDLLAKFAGFWVRGAASLHKLFRSDEDALPTFCGECAVCHEPVELSAVCKLPCDHTFHMSCISSSASCPTCRHAFDLHVDCVSFFSI